MSPNLVSDIEKLIFRKLHFLRKKDERVRLLNGLLLTFSTAVFSLLFLGILEGLFYFSSPVRTLLSAFYALSLSSVLIFFVVRPLLSSAGLLKRRSDTDLAYLAGRKFPAIKDRLLNLLQISEEHKSGKGYYSPELVDASFSDLSEEIRKSDLSLAVTYEKPARTGRIVLYGLAFSLLLYALSPDFLGGGIFRLVNYEREFQSPGAFALTIEPGDIEAVRGDSITLRVFVTGEPQSGVSVYLRQDGQTDFEEIFIDRKTHNAFTYSMGRVRRTTEYYAARKDQRTDIHTIRVTDRPSISRLSVTLTYPEYTAVPPRTLDDNTGSFSALAGTRAGLAISASKELTRANIIFAGGDTVAMDHDGNRAVGYFSVDADDNYHIRVTDIDGIDNADPVEYSIRVINDEYPSLTILEPGRDVNIDESLRLPMLFRLRDDYGFSRLRLGYRLIESRYEAPQTEYSYFDIPLAGADRPVDRSTGPAMTPEMLVDFLWDVRDLRLAPEDAVSYHAVLYDNDMFSGPKSVRSEEYVFRLPSLDEIFAEMDRRQTGARENMERSAEEADRLRRDLEEIRRELQLAQNEMNWERRQRIGEMLDKYQELQNNLQEMEHQLDEMIEDMQNHNVLSYETLEKYMELQELYEQLTDPEFRKAMERLRRAMDGIDPNELREAMREITINEEQFRQSVERTLNLLKRIQIEQKVDELVKRAEEMVREQESVSEDIDDIAGDGDSDHGETKERIDMKMEDLTRQLDRLKEELSELRDRMEEFPAEMPLRDLQKIMDDLNKAQIDEMISDMRRQMQAGEMSEAGERHGSIMRNLSEMQENINQMQQSLLEDQLRQIVNELRRAMRNINELSKRQESLRDETRSLEPNMQILRDNIRRQNEMITDLNTVTEDLIQLSQKTFAVTPEMGMAVGQAFRQMQESISRLNDWHVSQASIRQESAMASLNEVSLLLHKSLEAMMQSGSGGGGMQGFMQQLQDMAGRQQRLNIDTQRLVGGEMSMEQRAQMARLAGEQEAVRRSLEELQKEADGIGARERILGDLERIEREMREVVRDLEADQLDPETVRRQERILSRLLDAQRSIRQRDYEERREGRVAGRITRESPPEIDLTTQEGLDRLRESLLRAVREGYSRDFELLIRRYFELLQETEQEQD